MLPLIYDWRAPVSGLFYDYDKGPGSYKAPAGLIEGEIAAKWQYKVKMEKWSMHLKAIPRLMTIF